MEKSKQPGRQASLKKAEFYTLVWEKGEGTMRRVTGYTDGQFYYYKENKKATAWACVLPSCRLGFIPPCGTLKEAQAAAHAALPTLHARMEKCSTQIDAAIDVTEALKRRMLQEDQLPEVIPVKTLCQPWSDGYSIVFSSYD